MQIIDDIMMSIHEYCNDPNAVENALYVLLQHYDFTKKSTELVEYVPDDNEMLIKKFLVAKKIKGCTERTLQYYGKGLRNVLDRIGKNVVDIRPDDIRVYIALRLRDGVEFVTVGNEKRILSSFFTWAHGEDIVHKNPMVAIDTMKQKKTKKNAFKDDEVVKMRDHLRTSREKAIFELLLSTGCRVTELSQIKLDDFQGDNSIVVHGKGRKDRYVYLNATARYALENYMADRKDNSLYLFPRMISAEIMFKKGVPKKEYRYWYKNPEYVKGNEHIEKGTIEYIIRRIGNECGVKAYPHKFRRTCATNALRNGMPIEMVSKMLGHDNLSTTQIYLDINDDQLKAMHERYVR
jgi:site-specific recombinase XerD